MDAVNLDQIMARAGLTRGAFYAHFKSKSDLFAEVMRRQHPVLAMLQSRKGEDGQTLWSEMRAIFADYLDPKNLEEVFAGCSFAALTGETARADVSVRAGFEQALEEVVSEMARGQTEIDHNRLRAGLILASGAVTKAAACESKAARQSILEAAAEAFDALLGARTLA